MLDAVIAVITKGEKVLLIQRAPGIRGGGYWAPVSGEVEPGSRLTMGSRLLLAF